MPDVAYEVVFIFILIVANGLFSMSEIAIISSRKARLLHWANEGNRKARTALELARSPNRFLSTVQIGITLVGIFAGAYGGATVAGSLSTWFQKMPYLAPYSETLGLVLVVLAITYLTLVIGELVPKRLALGHAERIASAVAQPMRALSILASPAVHLLSGSTDLILRLLRVRPTAEAPITEEEIRLLIDQATRAGMFHEAEREMVEGVFRLGDRRISVLMTPRPEMVWLDIEENPEEIRRKITESVHSRFPVGQGSLDQLLGVVETKDLLVRCLSGLPIDLKAVMKRPLFVPEGMPALQVLELIRQSRVHIALVIDEYGGTQGLVTHHDILEAIVGEVPSVGEVREPLAVERKDGSWLVDGMLPVDRLKEIFHISALPEENRGIYHTLGGFVMNQMGRVPSAGQSFEWSGLLFEVMDMDGRRVDKVLILRRPEETAEAEKGL